MRTCNVMHNVSLMMVKAGMVVVAMLMVMGEKVDYELIDLNMTLTLGHRTDRPKHDTNTRLPIYRKVDDKLTDLNMTLTLGHLSIER